MPNAKGQSRPGARGKADEGLEASASSEARSLGVGTRHALSHISNPNIFLARVGSLIKAHPCIGFDSQWRRLKAASHAKVLAGMRNSKTLPFPCRRFDYRRRR